MKTLPVSKFLTTGSAAIPSTGSFVACAISPASLVDLVTVGGRRLPPGAIVPCSQGDEIKAVRSSATVNARIIASVTGLTTAQDLTGVDSPGEELQLLMFEACDTLVPPGPRSPYAMSAVLPTANVPITAATAKLALRLPFSGRRQATVSVRSSLAAPDFDLNFVVRGVVYRLANGTTTGPFEAEAAQVTVPKTNPSAIGTGVVMSSVYHVGGGGDLQEDFDELQVWVWAAGATTGDIHVQAEAFGERDQ